MKSISLIMVTALSLSACGSGEPPAVSRDPAAVGSEYPRAATSADADHVRADQAVESLMSRLQGVLKGAVAEQGVVGAIDVCQQQAPLIATEIGNEMGVRVGRVPVHARGRNPDNGAAQWQAEALSRLESDHAAGRPVADLIVSQTSGLPHNVALRVMKGLETQPACLACHGKQLAAPVRQALKKHYPDDAATGFSVGDLRGAVWVEVPAG